MYKLILEAEDFITNAFIESSKDALFFKDIIMYQKYVCKLLINNNFQLTLKVDYDDYSNFFSSHPYSFRLKKENGEVVVIKNPIVKKNDLVECYRSFIPFIALDYFQDTHAISLLTHHQKGYAS